MKSNSPLYRTAGVAGVSLMLLLHGFLFLVGCGKTQDAARKELVQLGKKFNLDGLIESVGDNDKQAVTLFIKAGFDINASNHEGFTALYIAAMQGNTNIVKMLLDGGANPNAAVTSGTEKGCTPLFIAVGAGRLEAVRLLVAKGADVNAKDALGLTAMDYATGETKREMLKILQDHGAPRLTDATLAKLLEQFASSLRARMFQSMKAGESADACRKLIAEQLFNFQQGQGFSTNQLLEARVRAFNTTWDASIQFIQTGFSRDEERKAIQPFIELCKEIQSDSAVQRELLLSAAGKSETAVVKWLLDGGANVNVKSEAGFTPLMFAIQAGRNFDSTKTVEMLLNAGADCNSNYGPMGVTPTMLAAALGNMDVLKLLLAKKPDVNAVNTSGHRALLMARAANQSEAVVLLKDAGAKE